MGRLPLFELVLQPGLGEGEGLGGAAEKVKVELSADPQHGAETIDLITSKKWPPDLTMEANG